MFPPLGLTSLSPLIVFLISVMVAVIQLVLADRGWREEATRAISCFVSNTCLLTFQSLCCFLLKKFKLLRKQSFIILY